MRTGMGLGILCYAGVKKSGPITQEFLEEIEFRKGLYRIRCNPNPELDRSIAEMSFGFKFTS